MLKALLAAAIPLQRYVDQPSPTHHFINKNAVAILAADGYKRESTTLGQYLGHFDEGSDWADSGWRNVSHMYNPRLGMGFPGWPSAPEMVQEYWDLARRYHAEWNLPRMLFYLGAAAHLVQDLCVPHHAAARMFAGHHLFEAYARKHHHRFAVHDGGLYDLATTPVGWATKTADYTFHRYSYCITSFLKNRVIEEALIDLLPRAQRTTAGFVAFFFRQEGRQP